MKDPIKELIEDKVAEMMGRSLTNLSSFTEIIDEEWITEMIEEKSRYNKFH